MDASEKDYLTIVETNGLLLEHIPENMLTEKICLAAVTQTGKSAQFIPQYLMTPDVCLMIAERTDKLAQSKYLPSSDFVMEAILRNPRVVMNIPQSILTEEHCIAAVEKDGSLLHCVPESFRTHRVCEIAVTSSAFAFASVPEEARTNNLRMITLNKLFGTALPFDKHMSAEDIYVTAVVKLYPRICFHLLPQSTPNLWMRLIEVCPDAFLWITKPTDEMIALHKVLWEV